VRNQAEAYANQVVPLATGAAARLRQEADGYKARVVAQANGDAQRFVSVLTEYQKAPQVTRDRIYLDTMRDIYGGIRKIIIDSKSGGNLMYLPLDKVMQAAGSTPDPAAPAASAAAAANPPVTDVRTRDSARNRDREAR
ncbi:MAG: hypothetical protein LBF16_14065, partial [Pseudomonadales bacterium]|nr:hypothetical protein [Pseudomonadales bacterium]